MAEGWRSTLEEQIAAVEAEFISGAKVFSGIDFSGRISSSFLGAVVSWGGRARDARPLIDWLKSEKPITQEDRLELADMIERAELSSPKGRKGRPAKEETHEAYLKAKYLYKRCKKSLKRQNISAFGYSDALKIACIEWAVQRSGATLDTEAIHTLWDRAKAK